MSIQTVFKKLINLVKGKDRMKLYKNQIVRIKRFKERIPIGWAEEMKVYMGSVVVIDYIDTSLISYPEQWKILLKDTFNNRNITSWVWRGHNFEKVNTTIQRSEL